MQDEQAAHPAYFFLVKLTLRCVAFMRTVIAAVRLRVMFFCLFHCITTVRKNAKMQPVIFVW